MDVTLKIYRYNPEKDEKWHYENYTLEAEPTDRVLDLLERVKAYQDGTLSFRRSCGHGVCGSDALRINGRNLLACKVLIQDVGGKITVEPILGLKVIKDLIVDMDPFYDNFKKVMPYFVNDSPIPADGKERIQMPEDRERFDDSTKCIMCAACTTACPTFWGNDEFLGPAAMVTAHRFIFDNRDEAPGERLQVLADTSTLTGCRTAFNCTMACPRDIKITTAISELKHAMRTGKLE